MTPDPDPWHTFESVYYHKGAAYSLTPEGPRTTSAECPPGAVACAYEELPEALRAYLEAPRPRVMRVFG